MRCIVLPRAHMSHIAGLCSREQQIRLICANKPCLLVLPGTQILLDCSAGSTHTAGFVLPGAQMLLNCSAGGTNTAGSCSQEHKYRSICAPGSTNIAELCSREHKDCWIVLLGAHRLLHFSIVLPGAQISLDCSPGSCSRTRCGRCAPARGAGYAGAQRVCACK